MAYENIRLQQPNFCIAPIVGTFASIDTLNAIAYLRVKNTTGDTSVSYTFNPNIAQNTVIEYFDYIGPRNVSSFEDGMLFVTMESDISIEQCTIKKWVFNKVNSRLDLFNTIIKSTSGSEIMQCKNMAVARSYVSFSNATMSGTGFIRLNTVDEIHEGTTLYLGPSTNASYVNAYEEVQVTAISGTTVQITSTEGVAPLNYYNGTDNVTSLGNFYLFSDVGYGNDETKGSMYTLDNITGATLDYHNSALYNNILTSNYGTPFSKTVALIKYSELLYVNIDDHSIVKSSRLNTTTNIDEELDDILVVYAVAFTSNTQYRLQLELIHRNDFGGYARYTWATYNFHQASTVRSTDSITLLTDPVGVLSNQYTVTLKAFVRDQYGIALSNKLVYFNKDNADNGTWNPSDRSVLTDINGKCSIEYTSGWYSAIDPADPNEDFLFTAYTNGANILTGSTEVWTSTYAKLNVKYISKYEVTQLNNSFSSSTDLVEVSSFYSELGLLLKSTFYSSNWLSLLQDFESVTNLTLNKSFKSELDVINLKACEDTIGISQNLVSRHLPAGSNEDDVNIAQFLFIIDMDPQPFSLKNNVNTNIWVKLAPYGFDLNKSTVVFKVREQSYVGDTGFIEYQDTSRLEITEFDAGGGLIGLELLYTPENYFHNNAVVYVYFELYDNAVPPNRIEYDYYFYIIPDYLSPYIVNELPGREEHNVAVDSVVHFDIIDADVGVDISTLNLFINNRIKQFTYTAIIGGFRVEFLHPDPFLFQQTIEVSIRVQDSSGQGNVLYDMWRFYCQGSLLPYIDSSSLVPSACVRGLDTRTHTFTFRVFNTGDGLDENSITLLVGGLPRKVSTIPIIRRV